jgi:hypothetical protein
MTKASQQFDGACHCEGVGYKYRTSLAPENWVIRSCQCRFCRTHAALSTSDPAGSLQFIEHAGGALQRYRFGMKVTDFILCRRCGVYLGAAMRSDGGAFGIINARALLSLAVPLPRPAVMSYDDEQEAERIARRERRWTPITSD